MDLYEIRNTTKKFLIEGTPTSVEYEKALPLCKELLFFLFEIRQATPCCRKIVSVAPH